MAKKNVLKEMKLFTNNMPKTITEAMNFEGAPEEPGYDDAEIDAEMEPEHEEPKEEHIDWMGFVDDIRKKSLMGMAKLADNPDDPGYDVFKRLWQICDKAYNDQKQASGAMQQQGQMPQQQPQIPQRPM